MYLFGGDRRPWDASTWIASDDRVRGGKSHSYLSVAGGAVTFHGNLDITALGGAGFASQRTVDDFPTLDLSDYEAIDLDVGSADGKKYTLVLKDTILPKRPDGREQSTTSWEHDFRCAASGGGRHVVLNFHDFQPTYRGRPQPQAPPLDLRSIKRISVMVRSFFGEQNGDFKLVIKSVSASRPDPSSPIFPIEL